MRLNRPAWLVAAPALLVAAWTIAPLATGARTLVLRDVLNTHLALRAGPAEALRDLELPLIDPLRGAGQPALGNANAVLFYPDDLLLLVGSTLWQLNAHFWIHWLIAGFAMAWLGRRWGLDPAAAAVAGVAYASSGYVLSQLELYNSVAAAALAPALAAATLAAAERPGSGARAAAAGALWALLLLGGDPTLAALAGAVALTVGLARHGRRAMAPRLALALAAGTLVAAPQLIATAGIWSESYRAVAPGGAGGGGRGPAALLDLVLPLVFGRPDGTLWSQALFGGYPALYATLAPGTVALLLACGAGRPRSREARALAALAVTGGAIVFLGTTPVGRGLVAALGGAFRYPDKLALWPSMALALASGTGAAALGRGGVASRRLAIAGAALAVTTGFLALALRLGDGGMAGALARLGGARDPAAVVTLESFRWFALATTLALAAAAVAGLVRTPVLPGTARLAALAGLQAVLQVALLGPLLLSDDARVYREPSPLLSRVGKGPVVVQGGYGGLFGVPDPLPDPGRPPGPAYLDLQRRAHLELYGGTARLAGVATDLDPSPEGLSHFTLAAAAQWMRRAEDRERVAILAALGVGQLLVPRPLADGSGADEVARIDLPPPGRTQWLYRIPGALPEAALFGEVEWADDPRSVLERLTAPGFDVARRAVVAGRGEPWNGPPGRVEWLERGRDRAALRVDSEAGGLLVLRRSYLPIWRAEIDGRPAAPSIAQFSRLAVLVPAGRHEVGLRIDRTPLRVALAVSVLGALALLLIARRGAREQPPKPA